MTHRDIVRAQLRIDEDVRAKPYLDSVGKLMIGCGRNLYDKGLRPDEIALMLENDIVDAEADARALFPSFDRLSENRRAVLVNMAFNLGGKRLAGFGNMRAAVAAGDFKRAAAEMLDLSMNEYLRDGNLNAAFLRAHTMGVKLEKMKERLNDIKYRRA